MPNSTAVVLNNILADRQAQTRSTGHTIVEPEERSEDVLLVFWWYTNTVVFDLKGELVTVLYYRNSDSWLSAFLCIA